MARKTYSIIIIVLIGSVLTFAGLQVERIYHQKQISKTEKLFRQKFLLSKEEKVAVCNYENDWQVVMALNNLWLVKDEKIYLSDLNKNQSNEFKNIPIQPQDSPLLDYYHLYQNCLW